MKNNSFRSKINTNKIHFDFILSIRSLTHYIFQSHSSLPQVNANICTKMAKRSNQNCFSIKFLKCCHNVHRSHNQSLEKALTWASNEMHSTNEGIRCEFYCLFVPRIQHILCQSINLIPFEIFGYNKFRLMKGTFDE